MQEVGKALLPGVELAISESGKTVNISRNRKGKRCIIYTGAIEIFVNINNSLFIVAIVGS